MTSLTMRQTFYISFIFLIQEVCTGLSLWSPQSGKFDEDPQHCALIKLLIMRCTDLSSIDNHFKGIMNIYKNDVSELSESFIASIQPTILPALLDLVGENGFQIGNTSSSQLSTLQVESKTAFTALEKFIIYLKFFNGQVKQLRKVCNRILRSDKYKRHEKAVVNNLLNSMRHKKETDWHTIWYVGMTLRGLDARQAEKYPRIMEEFGEVEMIAIASVPEENTLHALMMESLVGGIIQSATNNTLSLAEDDEYEDASFKDMGSVNTAHTGPVDWTSIWEWVRLHHRSYKDCVVEDLAFAPDAVKMWIEFNRAFIAECMNKKNGSNILIEDYKPTLHEVSIAGGYKSLKLGRGIHNKNDPRLVNAGVDTWGAYCMLEKNDEGKSVHAVKNGTISMLEKNDEGKSVHAVNMAEAQRLKKLEDGATEMELFCFQCSNPR